MENYTSKLLNAKYPIEFFLLAFQLYIRIVNND